MAGKKGERTERVSMRSSKDLERCGLGCAGCKCTLVAYMVNAWAARQNGTGKKGERTERVSMRSSKDLERCALSSEGCKCTLVAHTAKAWAARQNEIRSGQAGKKGERTKRFHALIKGPR